MALAELPEGEEGVYNRFVLCPSLEAYETARGRLHGALALLLEGVAWRLGLRETPPPAEGTDGEVRAYLLALEAHHRLGRDDREGAARLLEEAARCVEEISPVFAARLYAERGGLEGGLAGPGLRAVPFYRRSLDLFADTAFEQAQAEVWLQLGAAYQTEAQGRRELLLEAIRAYQEALKVLRPERDPEPYVLAQMNLGLCYLVLPMSEEGARLRPAIAVQALREAQKWADKETHPQLWASATLNLANALQQLPSAHPEQNLWEAVALYEEVLAVRRKEEDPLGFARVLANQGNALAHLGLFAQAVPRLEEARGLFEELGEVEGARAVETVLAEIQALRQGRGLAKGGRSDGAV